METSNHLLGEIFTLGGFAVGILIFFLRASKSDFSKRQAAWLALAALTGGVLGAKLLRFIFAAGAGAPNLALLSDGRTIIGGILVGWCAVELAKAKMGITKSTGDGFALALAAGEAVGRIGCFFNGCCTGIAASVPWAVYQQGCWRHPAQLYSSVFAFLICLSLLYLGRYPRFKNKLFRFYILFYGSGRFALEFLRQRTEMFMGLSAAQWVCLEMVVMLAGAMAIVHFINSRQTVSDEANG
jgi:phosphatidylglycerol:prolipoprotein diacylglycerol transferase